MRLRTFGGLGIDGSAQALGGAAGQRRPLALLLLFAVSGKRGVSRDKLLTYLWPEADTDHARSALRQALYALRRDLAAPELFEGTTELRLNDSLLSSDVAEFDAAVATGDKAGRERAIALYNGPLADGFCLTGAPEFERWLDVERRTRAQQFAAAGEWLAREAAREGRFEEAVAMWRQISVQDPLNARVALQLVQVLAESGDRAGALQHARVHEALVREELGAAPDPAILELAERLRSAPVVRRDAGALSVPVPPSASERVVPNGHAPAVPTPAEHLPRPSRRSLVTGGLLALATVVVVTMGIRFLEQRSLARSLDATAVAVAPFEVEPKMQFWREGVMDILAHNLDGAGPLRSVATSLSVKRWSGRADRSSALDLARNTGAGIVLYGYIVPAGPDSVRAAASVLDAKSGKLETISRRESAERMDRLTDSLTVDVLRVLGSWFPLGAVRRTTLVAASDIDALKAFLRGEQFYRRVQWDSARAAFEEAVARDSNFTLALRRLGQVISWQRNVSDVAADSYLLRAGALNHHLGPRDSLLVLADSLTAAAGMTPDYGQEWPFARRLFDVLSDARQRYRDDPEVWFASGEAGYHFGFGAVLTVAPKEILAAFDQAISLDSSFSPAYEHQPELALEVGGVALASRYVDAALARHPDEPRMLLLRQLLHVHNSADTSMDSVATRVISSVRTALRRWPDSAETALQLTRILVGRPGGELFRTRLVAQLALRGHIREALRRAAEGNMKSTGVVALAYLGVAAAESLATRMMQIGSDSTEVAELVPAWWAMRRDTLSLSAYLAAARRLQGSPDPARRRRSLYDAVAGEAYLLLARGDSTNALRLLSTLSDSLCTICYVDRWMRARLLESVGRDQEALPLLRERMVGAESPFELLMALERGRVAERLGMRDEAVRAYGFVLNAWRGGEPQVQSFVTEARTGLARLGGSAPLTLRG